MTYSTTQGWDLVFVLIVNSIHYKMFNLDDITKENNKEHNEKWPYVPDHPYGILIIGGSGTGKTILLLNLIDEENDIDKNYLFAKELSEAKYEFLIKKC